MRIVYIAVAVAALLSGCSKEQPEKPAAVSYVQSDYAKNPDGDCAVRPADFYSEKVKTPAGIEESIVTYCQYRVRGDYHSREGTDGAGIDQRRAHVGKGIACLREAIAIANALSTCWRLSRASLAPPQSTPSSQPE